MKVLYDEKLDRFVMVFDGKMYLFDEFGVYDVRGKPLSPEEVPQVVRVAAAVMTEAKAVHMVEERGMKKRLINVRFAVQGLPSNIDEKRYRAFLRSRDDIFVPEGFMKKLSEREVDPIHGLIGKYFGAYVHTRGGPYVFIDPRAAVYEAFVAVKRYSNDGKVLPVGWWEKKYYSNYTGRSSFTVFGELHSPNVSRRVWLMKYHREETGDDVKVVHKAFLEAIREFGGVDFNGWAARLSDSTFKVLSKRFGDELYDRVLEGFEKKADLEVFDEVGMPPEFRTPVNYVLLKKWAVVAVPGVNLMHRVTAGDLYAYKKLINKKFGDFLSSSFYHEGREGVPVVVDGEDDIHFVLRQ